jgi:hypothetical protein
MSRTIELHTSLDIPAGLARNELLRIMKAIHDRKPPHEDAALHVGLHDLRLPVPGEIAVPIETSVQERPFQYECTLKIEAANGQHLFPKFVGNVNVSPLGESGSELWLQGQYDVPFGGLGAAIDVTLMRGAAERSLRAFLDMLSSALVANVKRDQEKDVSRRRAGSGA